MSIEQPESEAGIIFEAKVRKLYEERIRKIENEQSRLSSQLEFEASKLRLQVEQYMKVIERNSLQLMGDGDTKEGLLEWKRRVDERHKNMRKAIVSVGTVAATVLLEFVREKLAVFLK